MDNFRIKIKSYTLWRYCQLYQEVMEVPLSMKIAFTLKEPYASKCLEGVVILAGNKKLCLIPSKKFYKGV